ncbi:MAG: acyl carrier protein [Actinomycetota bacterium]
MDTTKRIREFVTEEILFEENGAARLADDSPLLDGMIDSMALMRLVAFLEEEFEVQIDDVDITEENFRTVKDIAQLVERTKAG